MAEIKDETQILAGDEYRRVVKLGADIGYALGTDGDFRVLSAVLGEKQVVLFEAVSGTDRYPPGRNMHVEMSAEEFDRLVEAVQKFRADQETREAREREARKAGGSGDDYDPFLDADDLP